MDFILDPQTLSIIGVVLAVIAFVYALRFARSKGIDTNQLAKDVAQAIDYAQVLLALTKATEATKGKIGTGLDAAKVVAQFVTETNIATTKEEERQLANKLVNDLLNKFKLDPTEAEKVFMNETIEQALSDKRNRNTIAVVKEIPPVK